MMLCVRNRLKFDSLITNNFHLSSLICGQKGKSNGKAPIWFSNHDVIVKLVLLMVKLASYQTES